MYSAPACSITRKQRVDGLTEDTKTFFRMPTSPRGWVSSKPLQYNQTGGQLRLFWYVISGWSRSNMIASNKIFRQSAKLGASILFRQYFKKRPAKLSETRHYNKKTRAWCERSMPSVIGDLSLRAKTRNLTCRKARPKPPTTLSPI